MLVLPEEKPFDARAMAEGCANRAANEAKRWQELKLLLDVLRDDPGADAVFRVFGMHAPDVRIYSSVPNPLAPEATEALGRAIRSIAAAGGPSISDPGGLLSMLCSGHRPRHSEIPTFTDGEPDRGWLDGRTFPGVAA